MDAHSGVVTLRGALDRESSDSYVLPVYVTEESSSLFDVATITVRVTDVNDHAPEFRPGACYQLSVPENSELAVIHTVAAWDADAGANGEISYSITGKMSAIRRL